jgi:outer membrane protein
MIEVPMRSWSFSRSLRVVGVAIGVTMTLASGGAAQEVAAGRTLSLDEAIRTSLAQNRELESARFELASADALVREAWSAVYPTVNASASYTRNLDVPGQFLPARFFDPDAGENDQVLVRFGADNTWGGSLRLEQPLFQASAFIGVGAASRYNALQRELVRGRAQAIVTQARSTYYDVLLAREAVRLNSESVRRVRQTLEETRAMNRAGMVGDYDVLRLEVELANLEPALRRAENTLDAARRTLAVNLALEELGAVDVEGSLSELDLEPGATHDAEARALLSGFGLDAPEARDADGLVQLAMENRSEVRQQRLTESLRTAELRAEQSEYLPRIALFATYAYNAQADGSINPFGFTDARSTSTPQVGLQVTMPIFSGFSRPARVQQKRAGLLQAGTMARETEARVENQVRTLHGEVRESLSRAGRRRTPAGRRSAAIRSPARSTARGSAAGSSSRTRRWRSGRASSTTHRRSTTTSGPGPGSTKPWARYRSNHDAPDRPLHEASARSDNQPGDPENRDERHIQGVGVHAAPDGGRRGAGLFRGGDVGGGDRGERAGGPRGQRRGGRGRGARFHGLRAGGRQVRANQDVTIAAEESGPIRQLLVPKGSLVRAGQPIARIDDRLLRAQAEQAASEAALAAETYERQRRLWEEDRVGTEMAYLRARYGAQTAEAGARALRERLERTVVRAPIAGLLDDRLVEVGTMVMPGTPVARIVDVSRVKVTGGVPERFAGEIARGAVALISIDGSAAREFEGRIDFVGASVEEQGRTFPVEIVVPNPGGGLKPGMIANVRVTRGQIESALLIPQEAVLRTEDGYIVYLAVEQGDEVRAEARPVVLGPTQANQVLVTNGLAAGDRIVVVGQNKIAGGDRLQIVERGRAG